MINDKEFIDRIKNFVYPHTCEKCFQEKTCTKIMIPNDWCYKGIAQWILYGEKDDE